MNHWPFIIAAYGLTFAAMLATSLWAWSSARRAEKRATELTRRD